MTRRILIFHPYFGDGGIERGALILAREFARHGYRTLIASFRAKQAYREAGAHADFVDLGVSRAVFSVFPLARLIRRERPACIVSAQSYANLIAIVARWMSGVPVRLIVTERVAISQERLRFTERIGFGVWKNRFILWLMKRLYGYADVVAANSRDGAEDLERVLGLRPGSVRVLHNPTHDPAARVRAEQAVEHPFFSAKTLPVIVSAGRFSPQKDFDTLVRAFALARRQVPSRLIILGEGELRGALVSRARELGVEEFVSLPGFVENSYQYVARADLFVLSSLYEGMPNALIEAVSLDVPAVSTDCLSGPREILLDGRGGVLTPVGDAEALAQAIVNVLRNPEAAKARVAVAREGLNRFHAPAAAAAYLDVMTLEKGARVNSSLGTL